MAWDDISKSLGTVIEERLSNPLVSSVALSWVGWNFKFLLIVFSNNTVSDKLNLFERVYPNIWWGIGFGAVLPVLTAYGYLYLLPKVSKPFFRKWRENLRDFNGIKEEVPIDQIISKTEKIALIEEQSKVREESELVRTENRKLKADLGLAQAKTDNYDALATNNSKLTLQVGELENAVMQKDADLLAANNKLADLVSELNKLPALEAALEAVKTENTKLHAEASVQATQHIALRAEMTTANDRLKNAENRILVAEDRARSKHVEAFSQAVFQSGFNDKLTANQSKRLTTIFTEADNGTRDPSSMYRTVINMMRQRPNKPKVQEMTVADLNHSLRNPQIPGLEDLLPEKKATPDALRANPGFQRVVHTKMKPSSES